MTTGKEGKEEARWISHIFPKRLREAIDDKDGMSLYSLSFHTGIHENTIRAYLSGSRAPAVPQAALIARVLDESLDWLLGVYEPGRETEVKDITSPSDIELQVMTAIAVENDVGTTPTFSSVARAVNISKQRTARIVRRLAVAGWVDISQAKRRTPGSISVTQRFYTWMDGPAKEVKDERNGKQPTNSRAGAGDVQLRTS